jgi:hypothetical protein
MPDAPADRWEFSLLVDRTNRILEARGLYELYLGARPGQLINRHLITFIADSQRLAFLRYMARLAVEGRGDSVVVTIATPALGVKRFTMAAKPGDSGTSWWTMFAQEDSRAEVLSAGAAPFASEGELGAIADAHDHAEAPLDVTLFRAKGLSDESILSDAGRQALDDDLGETLRDHAQERVVARPELGEYALLHSRDSDAAKIGESLVAVAERHDVPAEQLRLTRETRRLGPEASAAAALQEMRRKINAVEPASPQGLIIASKWVPPAVVLISLIVLLSWLLISRGH